MRKVFTWLKKNCSLMIVLMVVIVSLLIHFVNSYYLFRLVVSIEWLQIALLVVTMVLSCILIAICSGILCMQKLKVCNLKDLFLDLGLWIITNAIYFIILLTAWNGRNWYYFWAIAFVLLYNVPYCITSIYLYKKNPLGIYFYISLMYFSTYGVIEVMGIYMNLNGAQWGEFLANALQTIGKEYIISIALSIFVQMIKNK